MPESICVLGAGSWGTTLASVIAEKGHRVRLWSRRPELTDEIKRTGINKAYLPEFKLPSTIEPTSDPAHALFEADVIVFAVPSAYLRSTASMLRPLIGLPQVIISTTKGIERDSGLRMTQVLSQELGSSLAPLITALSGPNISRELMMKMPTASVIAGTEQASSLARDILMTDYFRVYTSNDTVGVELGGALKNIMAIGAGMSDGLGYGANTKAALLTRGLVEIVRFGCAMGAEAETFHGLSGLGDLMVTAMSPDSRNRRFGASIGGGSSVRDALQSSHMVVEGMPTVLAAWELSERMGIDMPITRTIKAVLYEGLQAGQAVRGLMMRQARPERSI